MDNKRRQYEQSSTSAPSAPEAAVEATAPISSASGCSRQPGSSGGGGGESFVKQRCRHEVGRLEEELRRAQRVNMEYKRICTELGLTVDDQKRKLNEQQKAVKPGMPIVAHSAFFPTAPRGLLQITDIGEHKAMVSWGKPAHDGGSDITHYLLETRDLGHCQAVLGEDEATWVVVSSAVRELFFIISDMFYGHVYDFRVCACNANGKGDPLVARLTFGVPSPPVLLRVVDVCCCYAVLSWQRPKRDGVGPVRGYIVEKKEEGTDWQKCTKSPLMATSVRVTNLIGGHKYSFRITAVNDVGKSAPAQICFCGVLFKPAAATGGQVPEVFIQDVRTLVQGDNRDKVVPDPIMEDPQIGQNACALVEVTCKIRNTAGAMNICIQCKVNKNNVEDQANASKTSAQKMPVKTSAAKTSAAKTAASAHKLLVKTSAAKTHTSAHKMPVNASAAKTAASAHKLPVKTSAAKTHTSAHKMPVNASAAKTAASAHKLLVKTSAAKTHTSAHKMPVNASAAKTAASAHKLLVKTSAAKTHTSAHKMPVNASAAKTAASAHKLPVKTSAAKTHTSAHKMPVNASAAKTAASAHKLPVKTSAAKTHTSAHKMPVNASAAKTPTAVHKIPVKTSSARVPNDGRNGTVPERPRRHAPNNVRVLMHRRPRPSLRCSLSNMRQKFQKGRQAYFKPAAAAKGNKAPEAPIPPPSKLLRSKPFLRENNAERDGDGQQEE
ncbi:hypothetical protein niasHT_039913 [Heterodera trifolii]|uniref:Fibronectin type-III domain-containing protein n=1 Tax=Heterodera trifolii TaxID=157864 RepID=A0ABD2I7M9_9BILA